MIEIDRQGDLKGLGNNDLSPVKAKFFSKILLFMKMLLQIIIVQPLY